MRKIKSLSAPKERGFTGPVLAVKRTFGKIKCLLAFPFHHAIIAFATSFFFLQPFEDRLDFKISEDEK
jgi:hypothetical protein